MLLNFQGRTVLQVPAIDSDDAGALKKFPEDSRIEMKWIDVIKKIILAHVFLVQIKSRNWLFCK